MAATLGVNIYLSAGCGFDEQVAVLVEGFLSTFCSYLGECVEMADACFTRRVVRPASRAVSLDASASSRSNPAPFVMTRIYGGGGTPKTSDRQALNKRASRLRR